MTNMTRRQLYDLVWTKPMRDAAADIGISDVGLKKACVRHRVPVPPQGYWNKIHAGQKPHKSVFHEVDDARLNRVEIAGASNSLAPTVKKAMDEARARESAPEKRIAVPAIIQPTLPAAVRLAAALKRSKPDEKGLAYANDPKLLHVRVAAESVDRAVGLAEALLVASTERGFVSTSGSQHLTLTVDGEPIVLSLKENTKRVPHVTTKEETEREERRARAAHNKNWDLYSRLFQSTPRWDYQATGQLFVEIEGKEHLSARTRWSDTTNRKLEALLNDVVVGLITYAAARKERRAEQERREQEWKLERQRQEKARARAELEKARIEFLDGRMKAFEEIACLERFLKQLPTASPELDKLPLLQEFVYWAGQRVQRLKERGSAEALQKALEGSSLFGPDPRPTPYSWMRNNPE